MINKNTNQVGGQKETEFWKTTSVRLAVCFMDWNKCQTSNALPPLTHADPYGVVVAGLH